MSDHLKESEEHNIKCMACPHIHIYILYIYYVYLFHISISHIDVIYHVIPDVYICVCVCLYVYFITSSNQL